MALDCVIKGAQVVLASGVEPLCIGIEGDRIAAAAPEITEQARETIDARGLHIFPGVLDAHVHFNDPGRDSWEGVPTGSAALAAGGGTLFIDMPLNSSPPTLDAASFDRKLAACTGRARCDFALWGGLTPDNLGQLEALAERGVVGFKAFMSSSGIDDFRACDDDSLYRGMRIAASLGLPVAVHAENNGMTAALSALARGAGRTSVLDYLDSRPIARGGGGNLPRPRVCGGHRLRAPRGSHELRPGRRPDPPGSGGGALRCFLRDLPALPASLKR